jgi:hypothetical protein
MSTTPQAPATAAKAPFSWRRFGLELLYATLFNFGCALAVTFISSNGHFLNNLVVSMCIGTIAFLLIDGGRLLIWGFDRRPQWVKFAFIVLIAVPVAQILGSRLAANLLGYPPSVLGPVLSAQMMGMVAFTLLAAIVATVIFTGRENMLRAQAEAAGERARSEAVERQALQSQLQLLQAQIEPHMLFNTLANLQGLIGLDPARAQLMLDQLIQYLRATLSSSRAAATTLGQEVTLLDAYLGLMSVRMGARLIYTIDVPAELRAVSLPPMLLQPLVENAIVHGLEPKIDGGHIRISARRDGEQVELLVDDDGLGLDAPSSKSGTHLGVANTRDRLLALFGERASFALTPSASGGALARITFPDTLP